MIRTIPKFSLNPTRKAWLAALALGALAGSGVVLAQVMGDRGIPVVASSSDIVVSGIQVNATGKNIDEARETAWKLAQRKGWEKLGGPAITDAQLQSMVAAVVIEKEELGPRRYIATLGITFDRTRAGGLLGAGGGPQTHSAPMLTIPVLIDGGVQTVYQTRNPWQKVWAEFQPGVSAIDYVRPSGAGGDSLLLDAGQIGRRSRLWWRGILDEFGAADVLIPIARLQRQWPGGPVRGEFTARYGPDNRFLQSFTLEVPNEASVPGMLEQALKRFDTIFTGALQSGLLRPDPTLRGDGIVLDPTIAALISAERSMKAAEEAALAGEAVGEAIPTEGATNQSAQTQAPAVVGNFVVQVATPDGGAIDAALSSVRGTPGVRGAAISSTAIGGTSVMRVAYTGDLSALAAALRARGWNVTQGGNALSISR